MWHEVRSSTAGCAQGRIVAEHSWTLLQPTHTHTHTHTRRAHTYTHTHTHAYTQTRTTSLAYTHTHTQTHPHNTYIHMYTCLVWLWFPARPVQRIGQSPRVPVLRLFRGQCRCSREVRVRFRAVPAALRTAGDRARSASSLRQVPDVALLLVGPGPRAGRRLKSHSSQPQSKQQSLQQKKTEYTEELYI